MIYHQSVAEGMIMFECKLIPMSCNWICTSLLGCYWQCLHLSNCSNGHIPQLYHNSKVAGGVGNTLYGFVSVVFKEMFSLEQYYDVIQVSSSLRWRSTVCCCCWLQFLLQNPPEQSDHLQVNHASALSKQGVMGGGWRELCRVGGETMICEAWITKGVWSIHPRKSFWCYIVWDSEAFWSHLYLMCILLFLFSNSLNISI